MLFRSVVVVVVLSRAVSLSALLEWALENTHGASSPPGTIGANNALSVVGVVEWGQGDKLCCPV